MAKIDDKRPPRGERATAAVIGLICVFFFINSQFKLELFPGYDKILSAASLFVLLLLVVWLTRDESSKHQEATHAGIKELQDSSIEIKLSADTKYFRKWII